MNQKADVKAIMARFQGTSFDEASSTSAGNSKRPLQSTPSSGPVEQKKSLFETPSNTGSSKPPFLRNTAPSTNDSDAHDASRPRITPSKFSNTQEETSPTIKPLPGLKHTFGKPADVNSGELKSPTQKVPFSKTPVTSVVSEPKIPIPKLSVVANSKPSWVKDTALGDSVEGTPHKVPGVQQKPLSSIAKLRQHTEELAGANPETANKSSPALSITPKPMSNFKTAHSLFNKEKDGAEQTGNGAANKSLLTSTNSNLHPKPPTTKKPSFKKSLNTSQANGDGTAGPKINPLPNSLALGAPPAKPNRPPKVNLEPFKQGAKSSEEVPDFKKPVMPTPVPSPVSNPSFPAVLPPPALPTLPPRHPGAMNQQDDIYDDVDGGPPPLPSEVHPSQKGKESDEDEGEMYEDLDQRWDENSQDKKKDDKEEKKKLEAEKKEQKERLKKEQDARKKFKLTGPIEVIHEGNALVDCKGSKTDLALKKDQHLDIIRVMGNPEGKWLGRTLDGSIGYVKTTSVKIDFDRLKSCQAPPGFDPEVYDDIDVVSSDTGGNKKAGVVVLPPLPGGEGGEIYDDVADPNLDISSIDPKAAAVKLQGFLRMFDRNRRFSSTKVVPPPIQFVTGGNSEKPRAIDEEIYDDVDSQNAPVPPPIISLPGFKGRGKIEDVDPKKQKKFEKEEKEFRKKFKHEGEINVLYQVSVAATLTNKKWGGKELPLKPGEKLDVIVKAVDDKLICRNEDGKFGYVSTTYIMDDGEIYDDIGGEDCIYDND